MILIQLVLVSVVLACSNVLEEVKSDDSLLTTLKSWSPDDTQKAADDLDCLNQMVRRNYFESAKFLLTVRFEGTEDKALSKSLNEAQAIV